LPLGTEGYVDAFAPARDNGGPILPNALVTGAPDRVPDIAIALKSAGFDILAAGGMSADDTPDLKEGSVDCYVQLPGDAPWPAGRAIDRARAMITHEMLSRFESAAQFLPLLAPGATVLLVTEDPGHYSGHGAAPGGSADPGRTALRTLAGVLAEAIVRDCGRNGVRATVVSDDRAPDEIAALAALRPPEPLPWWLYAGVDTDLGFADWRNSVFCLESTRSP
jgi:hypothetical protein